MGWLAALAVCFYLPQVNAWGDQPTLEMVRLIVEWGGFCFLDKDKRGDFKVQTRLSETIHGGADIFIDRAGHARVFKAAEAYPERGHY